METATLDPRIRPRLMLWVALRYCRSKGFPMHDMEYRSAVNYATTRAVRKWNPESTCSPERLASLYSFEECVRTRKMLRKWRRQDAAQARTEADVQQPQTPIPLSDFEILQFVAAHGRKRAAKLLLLTCEQLRELLEDIQQRVRQLLH